MLGRGHSVVERALDPKSEDVGPSPGTQEAATGPCSVASVKQYKVVRKTAVMED